MPADEDADLTITGLHHFNIRVPMHLLDQIRDFYRDILGLEEGDRPPFHFAGYWLYAGKQAVLHLAATREGQELDTKVSSIDHVAFACTDYEGTCQRLESLGIRYRSMTVPALGHQQIFFRDPLGNGIELNFSPGDLDQ